MVAKGRQQLACARGATPCRASVAAALIAIVMGLAGLAGCATTRAVEAGRSFRDCDGCPELVGIPPGGPVTGFALGVYEVSQAEFARFVADTGRVMPGGCRVRVAGEWRRVGAASWTDPGYGRLPFAEEPVACVAWTDARDYAAWLARVTGLPYRLPTAAEWEYAARAGGGGRYPWGDDPDAACRAGNVYDASGAAADERPRAAFACDDGFVRAAPTGSFGTNALGLADLVGNLREWLADCADDASGGFAGGPVAASAGACSVRRVGGGSWAGGPARQRTDGGGRARPALRSATLGFRVARDR